MTTIVAGSGTIQTTTLEAFLIAAIRLAQTFEKNTSFNPTGLNYITSQESDDSETFSGNVNFPLFVSDNGGGGITYTVADYFTSANYNGGSGGTIKSPNLPQAIFEATIKQKNLELDVSKNPTGGNYINYSITSESLGSNSLASFSATYTELPLQVTNNLDGSRTSKGKPYLL